LSVPLENVRDAIMDDLVTIKRVKKDGSVDELYVNMASQKIDDGGNVVIPVDGIYGMLSIYPGDPLAEYELETAMGDAILISSFLMLDKLAVIDKFRYDFLRRVWPGEITILLTGRSQKNGSVIPLRVAKSPFINSIIMKVNRPMVFRSLKEKGKRVFSEQKIIENCRGMSDLIIIIKELCKNRPIPSVVDLSGSDLQILAEGKFPDEEIKSLYFLGQEDEYQ
jgi:tRNA A37 threonylcarbamoyladenosine synthetase subunit TsaC/SUA5/YrdC